MALTGQINISDLSQEVQRELQKELNKLLPKNRRSSSKMDKETKLLTVADIFHTMRGLNLAQQRAVLLFALKIIENTQKRFWRD
jgi:hypothetical protein